MPFDAKKNNYVGDNRKEQREKAIHVKSNKTGMVYEAENISIKEH